MIMGLLNKPRSGLSAISVSLFFILSLLLVIFFFGSNSSPDPAKSFISNSFLQWRNAFLAPFQSSVMRQRSRLEMVESALARARASIKKASQEACKNMSSNLEDPDYVPHGPIYRNANAFHRSYMEMEKIFKIYVYEEGEPPIFHSGPCMSIYSSEGRFIEEMEKGEFYRTGNPEEALVYFLPFSVVRMVQYLYVPGAPEFHAIDRTLQDYIDVISRRHSYWNRSVGADHFMLSCHDWGPYTTGNVPVLFNNSIRALCNANTSEGFDPSKDVSIPEINLRSSEFSLGGKPARERTTLAFYAGGIHGHIRHLLVTEWKEKDPDILVYEKAPEGMSYDEMMKGSRYCLCPSGYEVASPRVVEAIYSECVPVLISDGYVLPLSDVLNWEAFSVMVPVMEIPNLRRILDGITEEEYFRKQERVKQVQRHFAINGPPQRNIKNNLKQKSSGYVCMAPQVPIMKIVKKGDMTNPS